ncbi:MAG: hypothetical protein QM651_12190, partial [Rhodoblastus sp.]
MITSIHHIALATADLDAATRDYALLFGRAADGVLSSAGARQAWFSTGNIRFALVAPEGAGAAGEA